MKTERKCYMHQIVVSCTAECEFFEDGLPCPFRTPRQFWDKHLCQFCTKKIQDCGFENRVVRNKKTNDVVGCFGFEKKEVSK